jgi:plastocyanin
MTRPVALLATPLIALAVAACGSSSPKMQAANAGPPPGTSATTPTATSPVTTATPAQTANSSQANTVNLAADPSGMLRFTQSKLSTKAGKVTIDFTSGSPLPHDLVLIDSSSYSPTAKSLGQTPIFQGGTKTFTVTLKCGTYYHYCSVPGHRQAGMQGTLTVG